jgi:hypothetical protein
VTTIIQIPLQSETLTSQELAEITGCAHKRGQLQWLLANGWHHHTSRSLQPVVGRLYARLKMAGITPAAMASAATWQPDLSQVR